MNKSGYTDVATNVGIRILEKIKLIETFMQQDNWNNGQEFIACKLTENGENWVLENQDKLEFRFDASIDENEENDLPF